MQSDAKKKKKSNAKSKSFLAESKDTSQSRHSHTFFRLYPPHLPYRLEKFPTSLLECLSPGGQKVVCVGGWRTSPSWGSLRSHFHSPRRQHRTETNCTLQNSVLINYICLSPTFSFQGDKLLGQIRIQLSG